MRSLCVLPKKYSAFFSHFLISTTLTNTNLSNVKGYDWSHLPGSLVGSNLTGLNLSGADLIRGSQQPCLDRHQLDRRRAICFGISAAHWLLHVRNMYVLPILVVSKRVYYLCHIYSSLVTHLANRKRVKHLLLILLLQRSVEAMQQQPHPAPRPAIQPHGRSAQTTTKGSEQTISQVKLTNRLNGVAFGMHLSVTSHCLCFSLMFLSRFKWTLDFLACINKRSATSAFFTHIFFKAFKRTQNRHQHILYLRNVSLVWAAVNRCKTQSKSVTHSFELFTKLTS